MASLKKNIKNRIRLSEFIMDEYVKDPLEKKTKEQTERYWQAVHMYKILGTILEESD